MGIAILGRSKIGFIEGTCKKEDYGTNLTDLWERCNATVLSWIINCSHNYCESRKSSIATYFSKLRELWAEFDCLAPASGCDCPKSSEYEVFMRRQKLLQFLMGLNETYEQAREQIMMMDPLPTMNKAYSMLMERESQRSMANAVVPAENDEMTTLLTTKRLNNQKPRKNYNLLCDYNKMKGHGREGCYKLIGYPDDFKFKKKFGSNTAHNAMTWEFMPQVAGGRGQDTFKVPPIPHFTAEQYNQIIKLINKENMPKASANMVGSISAYFVDGNDHEWIVDFGATNHTTSNLEILEHKLEVAEIHTKKVHLPNGEVSNVTYIGFCNIANAGRIDNVLYLPEFKYNLFSVSKITNELNCCAAFYPDFYLFQDICSRKVKVIGKIDNCSVCLLAKQCSLSFSISSIRAEDIFYLLHVDVWGLYDVQTFDGNKLVLTIFYDHSRMTWVCLLKLKSDVSVLVKLVQTQFNRQVKVIRIDNKDVIFKEFFFPFKFKKQEKQPMLLDMNIQKHGATISPPANSPIHLPILNTEEQNALNDVLGIVDDG
ncbi:uncharacterized protein LOC142182342 [Nicotiana tabacum]|uniref:Uncharacterized protein LOC142182342 n=1 Tax=Nicotiana tabacum TaxID=4097 RepID=A0AC58UT85_TOBAC